MIMVTIYRIRLVFRIAVLSIAIWMAAMDQNSLIITNGLTLRNGITFLHILWTILAAETLLKFFPSKMVSMGCQKQFKSNFLPSRNPPRQSALDAWIREENVAAKKVLMVWLGINAVAVILYFTGIWSQTEMVLLSLCYYVLDLVCILFYCPFQSLIMKNRCCVTCRIFNWDSMMMFTPLIVIPSLFSWSLVGLALLLLICWETAYRKYPQRFLEESNENLQCAHCKDNLCKAKKHLSSFSGVSN